jgi:hypothetical protein
LQFLQSELRLASQEFKYESLILKLFKRRFVMKRIIFISFLSVVSFISGANAAEKYYEIVALHSRKCVDVANASVAHAAPIVQANCWGGGNQKWRLKDLGGGYFYVPITEDESREAGGDERWRDANADVLDPAVEGVLILIPGVAFDPSGNRVGRGRGWYDRLLARFERAHRMGLAFDLQLVGEVPREPWDVPMDSVVTPAGRLLPGRSFESSEGTPRC